MTSCFKKDMFSIFPVRVGYEGKVLAICFSSKLVMEVVFEQIVSLSAFSSETLNVFSFSLTA